MKSFSISAKEQALAKGIEIAGRMIKRVMMKRCAAACTSCVK